MHAQQAEHVAAIANVLAMLRGEPDASWSSLLSVMDKLERMRPRTLTFPAVLQGITTEDLRAAPAGSAVIEAFGAWRGVVTRLEGHNASTLLTLLSALRRVTQLRDAGADPGTLARYESAITAHLRRTWSVRQLPGPQADLRVEASRLTRRMDLLPMPWRLL